MMKQKAGSLDLRFLLTMLAAMLAVAGLSVWQSKQSAIGNLQWSQQYWLSPDPGGPYVPGDRQASTTTLPAGTKNVWLQMTFDFNQPLEQPAGLFVSVLGSFEAYWDDVPIGGAGIVGRSKEQEIPAPIDNVLLLPSTHSDAGHHSLRLRISAQHNPAFIENANIWVFAGAYNDLLMMTFKRAVPPLLMSSALLVIGLLCLLLATNNRAGRPYLLFGLLSLAMLMLIVAESWRGLWGYSYDWHTTRMQIVLTLSCVIALLLPALFASLLRLGLKQTLTWLGLAALLQLLIVLFIGGFDSRSLLVFLAGAAISVLICAQGMWQKQSNSAALLAALILFIAPVTFNAYAYMDQYFFLSFTILICLMLYFLSRSIEHNRHTLIQRELRLSRLELELVKRNVQPHFILNTLTAVEEWIDEDPPTAIAFIQALAEEFRQMASLSSQSAVSLEDELQLCQAHLNVMSYRAGTQLSLDIHISHPKQMIPPGILLTLLENAISHNHYRHGKFVFTVQQKREDKTMCLTFMAPVVSGRPSSKLQTGTGNQYVESRLRESYADNWQMQSHVSSTDWQVQLRLPLASGDIL
ncbi:hypothetical protein GCM10009092_30800 [Bowmanella denitrificans]|uniref:Signal transduction histidine kinase internal region domain-containing protein n=1 Tax=Bowmanella denitrificans TaxID=366582 RepID=A0ABP3H9N6_9ALTE